MFFFLLIIKGLINDPRIMLEIPSYFECRLTFNVMTLTLLHSEWPKLRRVCAILSAVG